MFFLQLNVNFDELKSPSIKEDNGLYFRVFIHQKQFKIKVAYIIET